MYILIVAYFREFPLRKQGRNGDPVDKLEYKDSDHDAMYIVGGNVSISRSAVGFAMDDCIDSGTGPGGYIKISGTYVQSCYHEGIALSDNGFNVPKTVYIEQVIVEDCQQGIELGFSTHLHTVYVENVIFSSNYVGLRIGDNYGWQVDGMLVCNRCLFHDNVIGILDLHATQFGPLKNNLIIRNSLLQPNDIHGNPNAFNVKSSVLGMSHIQIDGWMNPAVQTTFDFIKNKEFRCEVENYSTPWESARSCGHSDLDTIVTFEDNDDCFHSNPHVSKKN